MQRRPSVVAVLTFLRRVWSDLRLYQKGVVVVCLPLAAVALPNILFYAVDRERDRAEAALVRLTAAREAASAVEATLASAEAAVSARLLTDAPEFAEAFAEARAGLPQALGHLRASLTANPDETARLEQLERLVAARLDTLGRLAAAIGDTRSEGIKAQLLGGQEVAAAIRLELRALDERQAARLAAWSGRLRDRSRLLDTVVPVAAALALVGVVLAGALMAGGITRRVARLEAGAAELAEGRPLPDVPVGNDEIGRLARTLRQASTVLVERGRALRQARDEADRANRAKSEFLSRVGHELRTPLNAVLGYGQVLDMSGLREDQRECTRQILKSGRHLLDLINEILEVAQIEHRRTELSPEPLRLAEISADVVDLVQPLAAERGIRIEDGTQEPDDLYLVADRRRLKQVLLALLSNAVKYNRDAGVVRVSAALAGDRVRVSVADEGAGIEPALVGRLFAPFERLGADERGVEGTGLGLSLSRGLVERMGGEIGVESTPGRGSTFWFSLAAAPAPAEPPAVALPAALDSGPERTILVIEDNPANVGLLERVLGASPCVRVLAAMQGRLGFDLATERRIDLILLDLNLPDVSGLDLLARLRADERTRHVPVIVVTADEAPAQRRRATELGVADYVSKPFDLPRFLEAVNAALRTSTTDSPCHSTT